MQDMSDVQQALAKLQKYELSILRLSEPITAPHTKDASKRSSEVSQDGLDNPSPAQLASDLSHYKDLFSKLHFSYIEQVTKEKFLRAIVGDPPQVVEHYENVGLERELAAVKADLKAQKEDVAGLVADLEAQGQDLARRYESISLQTSQLSSLPADIYNLQSTITTLQSQSSTRPQSHSDDPSLSLPLPQTLSLLSQRQSQLSDIDAQIAALRKALPQKAMDAERLERNLKPLERERDAKVKEAEEARWRKEERDRGMGDDLELKGRWYRGVEQGLSGIVGS